MVRSSWIPTASSIRHLRIRHSLTLMPVFFFAVVRTPQVNFAHASLLFGILALMIFPASHGYNSYYDRDEDSIGGLETPPQVFPELLPLSMALEFVGLALTYYFFGTAAASILFAYGVASKLYSHPGVRLKAMPWWSLIVVASFQGPVIYWLVQLSTNVTKVLAIDYHGGVISFLMVAAAYPLTQIYQHDEDCRRGDLTLSRLLGIRGTFIFSTTCLCASLAALLLLPQTLYWIVFIAMQVPSGARIFAWASRTWVDSTEANYANAASTSTTLTLSSSIGFVVVFILGKFS